MDSTKRISEQKKLRINKSDIHSIFNAYLTKKGLRQTKQRKIILNVILNANDHIDVESILKKARKSDRSIGLATVYRSLQLMTEGGILVERRFTKDKSSFEVADDMSTHHDHLICNQCSHIVEFFNSNLEEMQIKISEKLGFKLKTHKLELFGDCLSPETCKYKTKS